MVGKVAEAVNKIVLREKIMNAASLMEELDMGEKEWNRYKGDILIEVAKLYQNGSWNFDYRGSLYSTSTSQRRKLVLLIGLAGSGKTYFASKISASANCKVIQCDEVAQREKSKVEMIEYFFPSSSKEEKETSKGNGNSNNNNIEDAAASRTVIVDGYLLQRGIRKDYLVDAFAVGVFDTIALYFDTPEDICIERSQKSKVMEQRNKLSKPTKEEGFSKVITIQPTSQDMNKIISDIVS
jgi:predicted kinase